MCLPDIGASGNNLINLAIVYTHAFNNMACIVFTWIVIDSRVITPAIWKNKL